MPLGSCWNALLDHEPHRHIGVVAHILAHARRLHRHGDAVGVPSWSAGPMPDSISSWGEADRAGAEDDLVALDDE